MILKLACLLVCAYSCFIPTNGLECQNPQDIVYTVDASGSVTLPNFEKVLGAIQNVVQDFNIGTSNSDTHVGFVTFDNIGYYQFGLGTYTTKTALTAAINAIPYTAGGTNIYNGMMMSLNQVFGQSGDRATVPDIMVVITDGQDSSNVSAAQQLAASRGITVWAVGVGNGFDYNQLVAVAGSASRVKNVTNFDFLEKALHEISCQCLDLFYECKGWAALGQCTTNTTIQQNCPVSCGLCNETCQDYNGELNCASRAAAGECFQNPEYMLVKCKKSCSYCDLCMNLHDGCYIFNQNLQLCNNPTNATHMHFYCGASCGDCTPNSNCSVGLDPVTHKCPRDWTYIPSEDACFWPTPTWQFQSTGRTICQQKGGELASIHSNITNNILSDFFPVDMPSIYTTQNRPFQHFIGLVRGNLLVLPTWLNPNWTDASAVNYTKWALLQPALLGVSTALVTYDSSNANWPRSFWITTPIDWNLPSFCEKSVCNPVTTTPPPSTTTEPRQCLDLYYECAGWAALGQCTTNTTIQLNCPVSCGKCNQTTCEDYHGEPNCIERASAGECFQNPEYMLVRCKKSCDYCDMCINLHDGCSIFNQNDHLCTNPNNATHMHFYCRASCGDCTPNSNCSIGLDPATHNCPRDWTYIPSEDACFWPTPTWQVQPAGRTICQQKGGELASIHGSTTNDFLTDFYPVDMPSNYATVNRPWQYFIGLMPNPGTTNWNTPTWTDTSAVNYTHWTTGIPPTVGVYSALITYNSSHPEWPRSYWVPTPFDWNLPSFCEKPICFPKTTTSPPSTTTEPRQCLDLYYECAGWAALGQCTTNTTIQLNCPVSCGKCNQTTCEDYHGELHCASRAAAGECFQNPEYMLVRCKKSCDYCDMCINLHDGCSIFNQNDHLCANPNNATHMHFYCRASCGDCTPNSNCSVGLDPATHNCPRDWTYIPSEDACFWPTPTWQIQPAGRTICQQKGGELASIHGSTTNDFLTDFYPVDMPSNYATVNRPWQYFIGLMPNPGTTNWNTPTWTDTSAVNYTHWTTGIPPTVGVYSALITYNSSHPEWPRSYWVPTPFDWNLPSFCEKPICFPKTTTSPPPTTTKPWQCLDLFYECAGWAALGRCATNATIRANCPVSCNQCDEPVCEDYDGETQCPERAAAGECYQNPEYMLVRCKKSCDYCGMCINLHDGCSVLSNPINFNLCNNVNNATHMHFYCRASCGDCTPNSNCSVGLDPVANKCPRDWTYIPSEDACYWPTPQWQLQPAGRTICQQKGGELASIHSSTTNDFLTDFFPTDMPSIYATMDVPWQHFIGLIPSSTWNTPTWTDTSAVNYTHWNTTNPPTVGVYSALITYNSSHPGWPRSYWVPTPFDWNIPSFCEKPICFPKTTTSPPPTTTKPWQCLDLFYECAGWAALGRCATNATIRANCPVSCNQCDEPVCEDYDGETQCPERAAAGECYQNPEYMLVRCKKSCDYCGMCINLHDGCSVLSNPINFNLCNNVNNATHMHFYCRASCGDCTPNSNCSVGLDPVANKCPRDWTYIPSEDACYWPTPQWQLQPAGRTICQQKGGELASIHSSTTNDFLTDFFPTDMPSIYATMDVPWQHFIGLIPSPTWNTPTWTDTSAVNYTHWNTTNPPTVGVYSALITYNSSHPGWPRSYWVPTPFDWNIPSFCKKPICFPM